MHFMDIPSYEAASPEKRRRRERGRRKKHNRYTPVPDCYTSGVFGGLDYAVLAGYFVLCAGLGWWTGRGQTNAGEFFKGGGAIPTWAVCLSILASETSALTFCAVPGQAY